MSAILPFLTRMMLTGTYDIPAAECVGSQRRDQHRRRWSPTAGRAGRRRPPPSSGPWTCSPPRSAWTRPRCAGATSCRPDAFPFTTPTGTTYDSGRVRDGARPRARGVRLRGAAGRAARRRAAGERRASSASACRSTWRSPRCRAAPSTRTCRCSRAGRCGRSRAPTPHGQGHDTAWAMLISERMGVPHRRHRGGARRHRRRAVGRPDGRLAVAAARRDERSGGPPGRWSTRPASWRPRCWRPIRPTSCSTPSAAASTWPARRRSPTGGPSWSRRPTRPASGRLFGEGDFTSPGGTFPSGAHVAVVEVDTETGKVTLQRLVAVDDAGRILNPLLAEGQVHGGPGPGRGAGAARRRACTTRTATR